jgi:chromate transport protein ChrA
VASLLAPFLRASTLHILFRGESRAVQGGCAGIVVAACGLMLSTGMRLVPAAAPTRIYLSAIIVGAVVVAFTQVKPVWIVVAGGMLGLIVR